MGRSAADASQTDGHWDTFQHNSSHSYRSPIEQFVGTNGHARSAYCRRGDHQLQNYHANSGPPSPGYASPTSFPGGDNVWSFGLKFTSPNMEFCCSEHLMWAKTHLGGRSGCSFLSLLVHNMPHNQSGCLMALPVLSTLKGNGYQKRTRLHKLLNENQICGYDQYSRSRWSWNSTYGVRLWDEFSPLPCLIYEGSCESDGGGGNQWPWIPTFYYVP